MQGCMFPYISAGMLDQKDTTYFDLSGALVYDPCIGDCGDVQGYIPTNQFAINNQVILNLNESTLNEMAKLSSTCGLDAVSYDQRNVGSQDNWPTNLLKYIEKYLQFPPPGHQPTEHESNRLVNKCFDVFNWFGEGMSFGQCPPLHSHVKFILQCFKPLRIVMLVQSLSRALRCCLIHAERITLVLVRWNIDKLTLSTGVVNKNPCCKCDDGILSSNTHNEYRR
jgi:hypothetical protein